MSLQSLLAVTTLTFVNLVYSEGSESKCQNNLALVVSIDSNRSGNDEWVTAFTAIRNSSVSPVNAGLDLTQVVTECDGNHMVKIQGVLKGRPVEKKQQKLSFHRKCSPNAAITNQGRTLQKLKPGDAAALTSRPLLDNEILTVRIDKKDQNPSHALGIGITTHSPLDLDIPNHMNTLKSGTWMFYNTHLYRNSEAILIDYLKFNLKDLKVGDKIGVMKSESGTLHFFLNGVDQGPAASNIPDVVHGVFELFSASFQGTIVDAE